jgi:hypothetical protein
VLHAAALATQAALNNPALQPYMHRQQQQQQQQQQHFSQQGAYLSTTQLSPSAGNGAGDCTQQCML